VPITEKWNHLSAQDWEQFASAWIAELEGSASSGEDLAQKVVLMNFTATPAQQWQFLVAAVGAARTEDHLAAIAAGPLEHLLVKHGDAYISLVENEAQNSKAFADAVAGVWRSSMSDEVWSRVQTIQASVRE
jgi:hypothetical protein